MNIKPLKKAVLSACLSACLSVSILGASGRALVLLVNRRLGTMLRVQVGKSDLIRLHLLPRYGFLSVCQPLKTIKANTIKTAGNSQLQCLSSRSAKDSLPIVVR